MAYDAQGKWADEDEDISKKLNGLLATDSPYMQAASTAGMQAAGKRGLQNSSIGVGAVENERIKAAMPIVTQESAQANAKNLSAQGYKQSGMLQDTQIKSDHDNLVLQLGSQERLQQAQAAAEKERLGMQLSSQEQVAANELKAAQARQDQQLKSTEGIATQDIASRENVAKMNVQSDERTKSSAAVSDVQTRFDNAVSAINNNKDIPAAARDGMVAEARRQYGAEMNLIEQMYNIDLDYPTAPTAPTQTAPTTPNNPWPMN